MNLPKNLIFIVTEIEIHINTLFHIVNVCITHFGDEFNVPY